MALSHPQRIVIRHADYAGAELDVTRCPRSSRRYS